jgi:hypothetical protein
MMRALAQLAIISALSVLVAGPVAAQEAYMEEIIIEENPFDVRLELPPPSAVQIMIERLILRAEAARTLEVQIANRNPIGTLLDQTKYIPIPLGASENRIDTFFMQNSMRPDLNPRDDDVLSLGR